MTDLGPQRGPSSSAKITAEWKVLKGIELQEEARKLAKTAHKGQTRWGGEDYFDHHVEQVVRIAKKNCMSIWNAYKPWNDIVYATDIVVATAYLHDTLEDTSVTKEDLLEKFPVIVVTMVEELTKKQGESYLNFILRIKNGSRGAQYVKICDLLHNLSTLPEKHKNRDKYEFAKYILQQDFHEIKL